jgi:hypothetical protein
MGGGGRGYIQTNFLSHVRLGKNYTIKYITFLVDMREFSSIKNPAKFFLRGVLFSSKKSLFKLRWTVINCY